MVLFLQVLSMQHISRQFVLPLFILLKHQVMFHVCVFEAGRKNEEMEMNGEVNGVESSITL